MNTLPNPWISRDHQVQAPNYHPLPVVIHRGEGIWLYDTEGKAYMDFLSGYSALCHGHSHPELIDTATQQLKALTLCSRAFYNDTLIKFAEKLTSLAGLEKVICMNTGAEAVETAIKAARRWGYQVKGIPPEKAEIIVARNNFHGRTISIISFSSEPKYQQDFGPLTLGFKIVPFGDSLALEKAITPYTCACLFEPFQGEAGILLPPKGWLREVRDLCTHHQVLMLLDEIQTGLGRTGKTFAFQHDNIMPDGLILGKALSGGIVPVSAFLSHKEVLDLLVPGSHGSTFGGAPFGAAVALKSLEILERENYAQRSADLGEYTLQALQNLEHPAIKTVRGKGLWIGIELDPQRVHARTLAERLMSNGLLCKETHDHVLRWIPPLIIQKQDLDRALEILQSTLKTF